MSNGALIGVLFAMMMAIQMMSDPRITRRFIRTTMIAVAFYLVHIAIGVGALFLLIKVGRGPHAIDGLLIAFLGWVGLGILGLIRFAPRLREPPRFLMHVGIGDIACFFAIAGGGAAVFGLI